MANKLLDKMFKKSVIKSLKKSLFTELETIENIAKRKALFSLTFSLQNTINSLNQSEDYVIPDDLRYISTVLKEEIRPNLKKDNEELVKSKIEKIEAILIGDQSSKEMQGPMQRLESYKKQCSFEMGLYENKIKSLEQKRLIAYKNNQETEHDILQSEIDFYQREKDSVYESFMQFEESFVLKHTFELSEKQYGRTLQAEKALGDPIAALDKYKKAKEAKDIQKASVSAVKAELDQLSNSSISTNLQPKSYRARREEEAKNEVLDEESKLASKTTDRQVTKEKK